MTDLRLSEQQDAVALASQAMTQNLAEAHEAMGMIKAFTFVGKLATVASWEEFCTACGTSRRKVDEDLQNLNAFGEEFMETSQRLGLGYREMRKLRQLPEEARAEIVEADYEIDTFNRHGLNAVLKALDKGSRPQLTRN